MTTSPAGSVALPLRLSIQQPALPRYRVPVFRALAQRPGIRLRLVYGQIPGGPPNVAPEGFDGVSEPERVLRLGSRQLLWHQAQCRIASRRCSDVAVLSWNLHYTSLVPALLRAKANGVGAVLWGHGYSKHEAGWRSGLRRSVTSLADALLFYNHTAAQRYIDAGVARERVFVALNALDQTPIQAARANCLAAPETLARFRAEHDLGAGPLLLFVSRFDHDNRIDLLLRAAARLAPAMPDLRIALVGKGPADAELRQLASSLGIASLVRFPGAIYDEAAIAPWFCAAHAFVYPANVGLSLLHAFGYGLPIVTGDRLDAQNPEIEALEHERNGLLFRDGDDASLAESLRRLIVDPPLRQRLAHEALATVTQRFTLSNMVDGMEAAVRFAAGQHRR